MGLSQLLSVSHLTALLCESQAIYFAAIPSYNRRQHETLLQLYLTLCAPLSHCITGDRAALLIHFDRRRRQCCQITYPESPLSGRWRFISDRLLLYREIPA